MPIAGSELDEGLETMRHRNMGSHQHRRKAAQSSVNHEAAAGAPPDPAVEMPPFDHPPSSGQGSAASESPLLTCWTSWRKTGEQQSSTLMRLKKPWVSH